MFARVSTYQGTAARIEELVRAFNETTDSLGQLSGFEGGYVLVERNTGKALSLTLWENEEAVRESERQAGQLRGQASETAGFSTESVVTYEVALEVPTVG